MNYSELPTPFGAVGVFWRGEQLTRVLLAPDLEPEFASKPKPKPGLKPKLESEPKQSKQEARQAPDPARQALGPAAWSEIPAWLRAELDAYFADPRHRFSCAIDPAGTAFQQQVWALIAAIPPGRPRTYGSLAKELGSSARAVGNACRANPVPLRIPCHRVIAARGLGGFAGDRSGRLVDIKRWLLEHEASLSPEQSGQLQ